MSTQDQQKSLKEMLLCAPESQLDHCLFPLIEKWSEPETALQVLEVLDKVIHGGLASGFTVALLQVLYSQAIENEKTTRAEVEAKAIWRNEHR